MAWWPLTRLHPAAKNQPRRDRYRVLHYSTWREPCGIAGYTESLMHALESQGVSGDIYPVNRIAMQYMAPIEIRDYLDQFCERARQYDLVHVQHEFSFFNSIDGDRTGSNRNFFGILERMKRARIPTVVTFHTEPFFLPPPPDGIKQHLRAWIKKQVLGPRLGWNPQRYFRSGQNQFRVIVHARKSRLAFARAGFAADRIHVMPMPVDARGEAIHIDRATAKQQLGIDPKCTLLSLFGFVARYKGHEVAVRALKELPQEYALAIVGGQHPMGGDRTINRLLELWKKEDPNRLIVTGYLPRTQLDLYHAATDFCLAPYIDDSLASSAAITWALSSGKPLIASSIPVFRELNLTHKCMVLTTPKCPQELAWQIRRLRENPEQQQEIVRNAQAYSRRYSWEFAGRFVKEIYEDMLGITPDWRTTAQRSANQPTQNDTTSDRLSPRS